MCDFFERLAEEREKLKKSQAEMAVLGGVSKRTYCYYESGQREPGVGFLSLIAAAGVDVCYIITGLRGGEGSAAKRSLVEPSLTQEEGELLAGYRRADAAGRAMLLAAARATPPIHSTVEDPDRDQSSGNVVKKAG